MKQMVEQCSVCAKAASQRKEPLVTTPLPDYPWQVAGSNLFEVNRDHHLVAVHCFSRYPEVIKLPTTTSTAVIAALKSIFSRLSIPEVLRSDNGPQYASQEFATFAESHGFRLVTSSPRYLQSNGQAERTVQTVKRMLKKSGDMCMALLSYRATPLPWCNLSPAELLMGRQDISELHYPKQIIPKWPYMYLPEFRKLNKTFKERQEYDFSKHH